MIVINQNEKSSYVQSFQALVCAYDDTRSRNYKQNYNRCAEAVNVPPGEYHKSAPRKQYLKKL